MSPTLIGHKIHNIVRNNRAEICSTGASFLPCLIGVAGILIYADINNINLIGPDNSLNLRLKTKNKCATSAKVIEAIENPTEKNVTKAFISQINKVNQLDVNNKHIDKYEKRLSNIYSSYINKLYPETKKIESPIVFSIKPESHTSMVHFDESISDDKKNIIKTKMEKDESYFNNIMPDNKIYLRFNC